MESERKRKSGYKWKSDDPYEELEKLHETPMTDRWKEDNKKAISRAEKQDEKPKAKKKYAKGGKVRGCGKAKQGVRKPKMY